MAIDVLTLVRQMLPAALDAMQKQVKNQHWNEVKDYAELALGKIAQDVAFIEAQVAAGRMTPEQARIHFDIQRNAAKTVLLGLEGVGLVAAEQTINAALAVVRDTVNKAVGFVLLV